MKKIASLSPSPIIVAWKNLSSAIFIFSEECKLYSSIFQMFYIILSLLGGKIEHPASLLCYANLICSTVDIPFDIHKLRLFQKYMWISQWKKLW